MPFRLLAHTHHAVRVTTDVQHHWQHPARVQSRGAVHRRLAHWDAQPVGAQVSQPKNSLSICDDRDAGLHAYSNIIDSPKWTVVIPAPMCVYVRQRGMYPYERM